MLLSRRDVSSVLSAAGVVLWCILTGPGACQALPLAREGRFVGPEGSGHGYALAASPGNPEIVYAAIDRMGVCRSLDGGRSFDPPSTHSLRGKRLTALAVHPTNPHMVLAAGYEHSGQRSSVVIWKSADAGQSWTPQFGHSDLRGCCSIRFSPHDPRYVLAGMTLRTYWGTYESALYRSTDSGQTWNPISSTQFTAGNQAFSAGAILFDRATSGRVLLGLSGAGSGYNYGLYQSLDFGATWIRINQVPFAGTRPAPVFDLVQDPAQASHLYAATSADSSTGYSPLYRSTDGGLSWTSGTAAVNYPSTSTLGCIYRLGMDPMEPHLMWAVSTPSYALNLDTGYSGTLAGRAPLFRSRDGGRNWEDASQLLWPALTSQTLSNPDMGVQGIVTGTGLRPRVLVAHAASGLWASKDTGNILLRVGGGLNMSQVLSISPEPGAHGEILAGIDSTESGLSSVRRGQPAVGGYSWTPGTGLPSAPRQTTHLARHAGDSLRVAALINGTLHLSQDAGASWEATPHTAANLSSPPGQPGRLYRHDGTSLLRSDDFSASWAAIGSNLTGLVSNYAYSTVGNELFVTTTASNPAVKHGVFFSADSGLSFERRSNGLPRRSTDVGLLTWAPGTPSRVFGMAYYSMTQASSNGTEWFPAPSSSYYFSDTDSSTSGSERVVWGASGYHVYRTIDDGATWVQLKPGGNGSNLSSITRLIASRSVPGRIWAVDSTSFFRSDDGGENWTRSLLPAEVQNPDAFAVDPSDPLRLYASRGSGRIYRSDNGGASWTAMTLPAGMTYSTFRILHVSPAGSSVIIASASGGTWITTNGGTSWSRWNLTNFLDDSELYQITAAPGSNSVLYAYNTWKIFYRSTDGGATWGRQGQLSTSTSGGYILRQRGLAVSPENPDVLLFSVARDNVYRSTDGGITWEAASDDLNSPVVSAVGVSPGNPDIVLAASGPVYRSTDKGMNWSQATAPAASNPMGSVRQFSFHPSNSGEVLAATSTGLWHSTDLGSTWVQFTPDLAGVDVQQVQLVSSGTRIDVIAATADAGIWATLPVSSVTAAGGWHGYH